MTGYDWLKVPTYKPVVPESNRNVPKYNKWKPEPARKYVSGVYRKGERK